MATTYGNGGAGFGHGGNHRGAEEARACIRSMMDQGSVESHRFYLALKTAWEMLKDRGYAVADPELTRTLAEFRSHFGDKPGLDRLRIHASLRSNPSRKLPQRMKTDAIARYHGLEKGEVVKATYSNEFVRFLEQYHFVV